MKSYPRCLLAPLVHAFLQATTGDQAGTAACLDEAADRILFRAGAADVSNNEMLSLGANLTGLEYVRAALRVPHGTSFPDYVYHFKHHCSYALVEASLGEYEHAEELIHALHGHIRKTSYFRVLGPCLHVIDTLLLDMQAKFSTAAAPAVQINHVAMPTAIFALA